MSDDVREMDTPDRALNTRGRLIGPARKLFERVLTLKSGKCLRVAIGGPGMTIGNLRRLAYHSPDFRGKVRVSFPSGKYAYLIRRSDAP